MNNIGKSYAGKSHVRFDKGGLVVIPALYSTMLCYHHFLLQKNSRLCSLYLVVLPQIFLSYIIWSIDEFPVFFRIISKPLPLTHANVAMGNVLIKNQTILDAFPHLGILISFFLIALLLLAFAA